MFYYYITDLEAKIEVNNVVFDFTDFINKIKY